MAVALGVVGAAIDILLHFLQLTPVGSKVGPRATGWVTLVGCLCMGISLARDFNLGAALMALFVAVLAVYSIRTGKEIH
jgi:hypothetical protein